MSRAPLLLLRVSTLPFETLAPLAGERSRPALDALAERDQVLASEAARVEDALHGAAGEPEAATDAEAVRARVALLRLRRDVHNRRRWKARDLEIAGRPLDLERYGEALRARSEAEARCREACLEDLVESRRALLDAASHPLVQDGIWLASRSLAARLHRLIRRDPARFGHEDRHVAGKLLAYLTRFCTKTSPNSLFCATALARFEDGPPAIEGHPGIERVDALLNVVESRKVAACLAVDPAVDGAIVPRPNPTLREDEEGWTFWKPASMREPDEDEVRSRVREHPVARAFLEEARNGHHVPALIAAVAARCGIDRDDLDPFYRTLVSRGLLLGEVDLPYNARRPLLTLAEATRRAGCSPGWLSAIEGIESQVDRLGQRSGRQRIEGVERATRALEALPHVRDLKPDELLRVDAASALRIRLPLQIHAELEEGLRPYVRLFSAFYPERIYRSTLARRFLQSFPPDTEVNLLDLYHGVFEPEDKKRPVVFPDPTRVAVGGEGAAAASEALTRAREHFARRAMEAAPGEEMEVTDAEVRALVGDFLEPRWSCGVLFQIEAGSLAALARGDYRLVLSSLFQGTGLALARFAHLFGDPVVRELRRGWSCLERPGTILAEMTYNHTYRTANAGLRPSLFEHEIELPGERGTPGARIIPLGDLTVRWDVRQDRFVLTWPGAGVEVLPVINSGVNPMGIISFLVDVGQQGLQPLGLFPGFHAEGVRHWPRFVSGRLVLFRERWAFGPGEWPAPSADEADSLVRVGLWRRRHGLPRHVFVHTASDPKPRYVDLDSPALVALLLRTTAADHAGEMHVTEMLPGPDGLWITDPRGRYASEFLVHLGTA